MNTQLSRLKISARVVQVAACSMVIALLAGCYVVPQNTYPQPVQPIVRIEPQGPSTFTARLYPANDLASAYGTVGAVVTNDMHGRGTFTSQIGSESFAGEATRKAGSRTEGIASGAGNRGGFLSCQYQMNTATQGTGTCEMSSGARFTMHVGS